MKPFLAVLVFAALPPIAAAQQQARPRPADPAAPVPAVRYESAFSGYRAFRDEPLAPWRDVNEEVARAGGHVGIVGGAVHGGHAQAKPSAHPPVPQPKPAKKPPASEPKPAEKPLYVDDSHQR